MHDHDPTDPTARRRHRPQPTDGRGDEFATCHLSVESELRRRREQTQRAEAALYEVAS